jgi:hypothetical protein
VAPIKTTKVDDTVKKYDKPVNNKNGGNSSSSEKGNISETTHAESI